MVPMVPTVLFCLSGEDVQFVCVWEVTMVPMVPLVLFCCSGEYIQRLGAGGVNGSHCPNGCLSGEDVQCVYAGGDRGSHGPNGSVLFVM